MYSNLAINYDADDKVLENTILILIVFEMCG